MKFAIYNFESIFFLEKKKARDIRKSIKFQKWYNVIFISLKLIDFDRTEQNEEQTVVAQGHDRNVKFAKGLILLLFSLLSLVFLTHNSPKYLQ